LGLGGQELGAITTELCSELEIAGKIAGFSNQLAMLMYIFS